MKYKPDKVDAVYIGFDEEWCIARILGSLTLCYPKLDKRSGKMSKNALGIAFSNTATMRKVANALILLAELEDKLETMK